jgi:hypothetical protein
MDDCGGLEGVALAFVLHIPAGHQAQFGIHVLRQPAQGCFVTVAPGFQQIRDFSRGFADGQPILPMGKELYQNVAALAVRFRLYQRKGNKLSE